MPGLGYPEGWERGLGGATAPGSRVKRDCSPGGRSRTKPARSATSPGTPPPLLLDNTPPPPRTPSPNHPMSAGEPLDTSLGMCVFIPPTQSSDLNLPPSRLSSAPGLHPKSAACALNLPAGLRGAGPPPSGRRAVETRLLGSKHEDFSSRSPSMSPHPSCLARGLSHRWGGAGLAPQKPRKGRRPAQHVAHVSVRLPTPSSPLPPRRGSDVVRVPSFRPGLNFSASGLLPPVFSRPHLLFSQVPAMHRLSFSSPVQ